VSAYLRFYLIYYNKSQENIEGDIYNSKEKETTRFMLLYWEKRLHKENIVKREREDVLII
jgi:hypothetical protein